MTEKSVVVVQFGPAGRAGGIIRIKLLLVVVSLDCLFATMGPRVGTQVTEVTVSLWPGYVMGMRVVVSETTCVRETIVSVWFGIVKHDRKSAIIESIGKDN